MIGRTTLTFFQEVGRVLGEQDADLFDMLRWFPAWKRKLAPGVTPLTDECAWLPFVVIRRLEKMLTRDMRVFEYGAGGSSVFFARRVAHVVTTEHDPSWGQRVAQFLQERGLTNWEMHVVPPTPAAQGTVQDPADPEGYASDSPEYAGLSFREYAATIDRYPDAHFDVVSIDGRARPSCAKHAVSKVKEGGFLMLDNADRTYYHSIHETLNAPAWLRIGFYGPVPYAEGFCRTCLWQKRQAE